MELDKQNPDKSLEQPSSLAAELLAITPVDVDSAKLESAEEVGHPKPAAGESAAAYLLRASDEEFKPKGRVSLDRPSERLVSKHCGQILADMDSLMASAPNAEAGYAHSLAEIGKITGRTTRSAPIEIGQNSAESYSNTLRDRRLFELNSSGNARSKHESYFNTLMAGAEAQEYKDRVLKNLNGKTIVNLGGGNASLQEQLAQSGVSAKVLNVEPYPGEQTPSSDTLVQANPASDNFFEQQEAVPPGSADEVWACFSVPFYLENSDQIRTMMSNTGKMLAPNGVARIWPMELIDSKDIADGEVRREALVASLRDMAEEGMNVDVVDAMGARALIIHKSKLVQN